MTARRGFTLIELMVAVTLTAVVGLLVYGAASAGLNTERRVRERDVEGRAERAWRTVVEDALRNLRSADDYGEGTLTLEQGTDVRGRPADRLRFVTAGGTPPLTPDADWEVTIEATAGGPVLTAVPLGVNAPPRRLPAPPGITGMDVRAFVAGAQGWREDWPTYPFLPRAIALTWWRGDAPAGPMTILALPQGVGR